MKLTLPVNPLRPSRHLTHFPKMTGQVEKQPTPIKRGQAPTDRGQADGCRHNWGRKITILTVCELILAACSGGTLPATLTPTPPASDTPTATIVWFPPTSTATAAPTLPPAPTEDDRPGLGNLIFTDSFDDPQYWNTANSAEASAMLTRNRLVLSIIAPGPLSITSLRSQPTVGDFYAEITADVSLCSGKDQYGLLFRAAGSGDYYRFVLNCSGQERLERVRGGVAYSVHDWLSSNDIPSGAPAQVELSVWAVGNEMRFFLNDNYQFSTVDPVFSSGGFGFYAYANGKSPVTISFSDLSVYSVAYTLPTPTPVPSWTLVPGGTPKP